MLGVQPAHHRDPADGSLATAPGDSGGRTHVGLEDDALLLRRARRELHEAVVIEVVEANLAVPEQLAAELGFALEGKLAHLAAVFVGGVVGG